MASDKKKTVSGVELLEQSKALCSAALGGFRENHDLCAKSGFFSKKTLLEVDTCAVDFRSLGLNTATVAKTVSNQWLDTVLIFYKNIADLDKDSIVELLKTLGGQAEELAQVFKVIAAWSRNLAGRMHEACVDTENEAEAFVKHFKEVVEDDQRVVDTAKANLDAAKAKYQSAKDDEHKWAVAQLATSWNLIGLIVTSIGLACAEAAVSSAAKAEAKAEQGLANSTRILEAAETKEKKAEVCLTANRFF